MLISKFLAVLTLLGFFIFFIKNKFTRKGYLLFVLYSLPLMNLGVTPESLGGLTIFDILSYFIFLFYFRKFLVIYKINKIYFFLFRILILLIFIGSITSEFANHSLISILSLFPIFIFAKLLIKELSVNPEFKANLIASLKIAFAISIVFMLMQITVGSKFTFYEELHSNTFSSEGNRYPGFFYDSQINSQFLGMISFIFLVNLKPNLNLTLFNCIQFLIALLFVFLSGGRSGLLGFCTGLIFLLIFSSWDLKKFIAISFLTSAAIFPFIKDSMTIFKRLNSIDESYQFRSSIWNNAYKIFENNKFLGIGLGNYKSYVTVYSPDQYLLLDNNEILILDQPENGYLKLLTELGILGFITIFSLIVIPIAKVFYSHFAVKKNYFVLAIIASLVCWFVSFNSLYTLSDKRIEIILTAFLCLLIYSKNEIGSSEV